MIQPKSTPEAQPLAGAAEAGAGSPADQAGQILEAWRQRLLARELDVSPRFLADDITNAGLLCRQLATRKRRIEAFIWSRLSNATHALIGRTAKAADADTAVRRSLAEALNQIIGAPSSERNAPEVHPEVIWDKARFTGIQLSTETRELLARQPKPKLPGSLRLHRLLLVDAFPTALRRVPQDTSRFVPHGTLFPTRDELESFDGLLRQLAVSAGLKEVTASAIARIDVRQPSMRLLDTLRLLVERLAFVPKNPRAQVIDAVQQSTAETKRSVYQALCRLRDSGMNLDSGWHHDLNLESLLGAGVSVSLADDLRCLHEVLPKGRPLKGAQPGLTRLINHAVFTDLFARSTLWDRDYSSVRDFCQWLRRLHELDPGGFESHVLGGDRILLNHLSFLSWERFTPPDEAAQKNAMRRKAENREQKKVRRIAEARSTGEAPRRRRRVVPQQEDASLVFNAPDWILVL